MVRMPISKLTAASATLLFFPPPSSAETRVVNLTRLLIRHRLLNGAQTPRDVRAFIYVRGNTMLRRATAMQWEKRDSSIKPWILIEKFDYVREMDWNLDLA